MKRKGDLVFSHPLLLVCTVFSPVRPDTHIRTIRRTISINSIVVVYPRHNGITHKIPTHIIRTLTAPDYQLTPIIILTTVIQALIPIQTAA
jgi:hypothetical protein